MQDIKITDIVIKNSRVLNMTKVDALCQSIREIGLLNPVILNRDGVLLSGHHRVEAFKKLGKEEIPAMTFEGKQEELAIIDENLVRNELCLLDRCFCLAAKKKIYQKMYPETKQGGDHRRGRKKDSFVEKMSKVLGKGKSTIKNEIFIGEHIAEEAKKEMSGRVFKKNELMDLAKLSTEEQLKYLSTAEQL